MTIFQKQVSVLFFFKNSGNLRCWLFPQFNLVMSNFWNRAALFSRFEAERLYVVFAAEISRTPVIPTRINLAIWNFRFEYKFSFFESAFEFHLPGDGRFDERNSWIFDQKCYCNGWKINPVRVSHPVVSSSEKMCLTQKVTFFNFSRRRWRMAPVALSLIGHQLFLWVQAIKLGEPSKWLCLPSFAMNDQYQFRQADFVGSGWLPNFWKGVRHNISFPQWFYEKLSRIVSTKMNWFQCTLWYGLVQLTISNKAKVAVAVEHDALALMDFPVVILLVEFCTDPQSCFLAVWFFALELPELILKFHPSIKLGILLLENGSSAVWIPQIRSRSWLNASSCFFGYSLLMVVLYLTKALLGQSHSSVDSLFCT